MMVYSRHHTWLFSAELMASYQLSPTLTTCNNQKWLRLRGAYYYTPKISQPTMLTTEWVATHCIHRQTATTTGMSVLPKFFLITPLIARGLFSGHFGQIKPLASTLRTITPPHSASRSYHWHCMHWQREL